MKIQLTVDLVPLAAVSTAAAGFVLSRSFHDGDDLAPSWSDELAHEVRHDEIDGEMSVVARVREEAVGRGASSLTG